jgi:hypothetical protein
MFLELIVYYESRNTEIPVSIWKNENFIW